MFTPRPNRAGLFRNLPVPLALLLLALAPLALGPVVMAQGGVDGSGMGQGEAEISELSNVTMGIRNGAGTSGERLTAMTDAVSSTLGDIRRCYASRVEELPTLQGTMRIHVTAQPRQRTEIDTAQNTAEDNALTRCVDRFLQRARYPRVDRPARVTVTLEFTNTAASGVERMRERSEAAAAVEVRRNGERLEAMGGTEDGEVRFTVRAPLTAETSAVRAVHRALRTSVAGLLDCRRRAGRRGMNSEGDIAFALSIPARGRTRVTTGRSTVQHDRAPICASRVLSRARYDRDASGQYEVRVQFRGETPALPTQ